MSQLRTSIVFAALVAMGGGCGPRPSTPLTAAAFAGDVGGVRAALTDTPADEMVDGWTPLVWAARGGRVGVMEVLLEAGADPNRADGRNGWTPLMHAIHKRRGPAARLLLARGADATRGAGATSPLQMAALDNDADLLRLLLQARPPRTQQVLAMAVAASGGAFADIDRPLLGSCHAEAVRVLLEADPTLARAAPGTGAVARWWARRRGCTEVAGLLAATPRGSGGR